jgi:hypothetical protein
MAKRLNRARAVTARLIRILESIVDFYNIRILI